MGHQVCGGWGGDGQEPWAHDGSWRGPRGLEAGAPHSFPRVPPARSGLARLTWLPGSCNLLLVPRPALRSQNPRSGGVLGARSS